MKKTLRRVAALACAATLLFPLNMEAQKLEALNRGLVGVKTGTGVFLSWRLLATDNEDVKFNLYRDGALVNADPLSTVTNYTDKQGAATSSYTLKTLDANGNEIETTELGEIWASNGKRIDLDRPVWTDDTNVTYSPNDMTVIDVDGDGEYELILKWDPSNAKDNSQGGVTGTVYIDCMKMDGTRLWRLDLGRNIRAGAHYTQMAAFDFDGDGKGELMIKTGPGTKDGKGNYVSQAADDATIKSADDTKIWLSGDGRVIGGQEWLTVFEGATGRAIHTVHYNPNRGMKINGEGGETADANWDDRSGRSDYKSYGNRGERYLCGVGHLCADHNATAVFTRGYYTYAYAWAVNFDGEKLSTEWYHSSHSKTQYSVTDRNGKKTTTTAPKNTGGRSSSNTMYGNGNHNMSMGDVDGDGFDEIIWGAAALDHDGSLLYATGFGHGDAIHLADHDPSRPGLEVFQVHEEGLSAEFGCWDLHDAATGEVLFKGGPASVDNGRGICGSFDPTQYGSVMASAKDGIFRSAITGAEMKANAASMNGRIYWTGSEYEQLLDGKKIQAFNGTTFGAITLEGNTCNGSKNTPNFSGDIIGDWREEVILWGEEGGKAYLTLYTTTADTKHRVVTLAHDRIYRLGMAWENVAYNQPPHLGYYLPDVVAPKVRILKPEGLGYYYNVKQGEAIESLTYMIFCAEEVEVENCPAGITYRWDAEKCTLTFEGVPTESGTVATKITAKRANGATTTATNSLRFKIAAGTAVTDIEALGEWAALTDGSLADGLEVTLDGTSPAVSIRLVAMSGATVYATTVSPNAQESVSVKAGNLPSGHYVLVVTDGSRTKTWRVTAK